MDCMMRLYSVSKCGRSYNGSAPWQPRRSFFHRSCLQRNRDGKPDFTWKQLIVHLGDTYNEFVNHLEQHQIQFMPKVVLRKDPAIGRYDRRCEVDYGN